MESKNKSVFERMKALEAENAKLKKVGGYYFGEMLDECGRYVEIFEEVAKMIQELFKGMAKYEGDKLYLQALEENVEGFKATVQYYNELKETLANAADEEDMLKRENNMLKRREWELKVENAKMEATIAKVEADGAKLKAERLEQENELLKQENLRLFLENGELIFSEMPSFVKNKNERPEPDTEF